jgi:hypothetical protein
MARAGRASAVEQDFAEMRAARCVPDSHRVGAPVPDRCGRALQVIADAEPVRADGFDCILETERNIIED